MSLSTHRAFLEERRVAHRNSHEEWGGGETVTAYQERCFPSPRHNSAEWSVLRLDGEIVASLALHPLYFVMWVNSFLVLALARFTPCRRCDVRAMR